MILITLTLTIITLFLILRLGKNLTEIILVSSLLAIGILGFTPFILTEYVGFNYSKSFDLIRICSYTLLSVFLFVFTYLVKVKRIQLESLSTGVEKKHLFILLILTSLFVLRGYYLPMLGWDAYALYDARAVMYTDGLIQSELVNISRYDSTNSLYYFAYPPMTSILHTMLYADNFETPMIIYGVFFVIYMLFMYLIIIKSKLNRIVKFLLFTAAVFNPMIVEQTNIAYTNLPTITFQIAALYLMLNIDKSNIYRNSILMGLMLMFSSWTRILEPYYIAFLIPWIFMIFKIKVRLVKRLFIVFITVIITISSRYLWHMFVENVVGSTDGFALNVGVVLSSVDVGLSLSNLIDVIFYLYTSMRGINIYILATIIVLLYKYTNNKMLFSNYFVPVGLSILTITIITVLGTLYFSITYSWWDKIPGSLLRSNMILVPLLCILLSSIYGLSLIHI